MHRRNFLKLVAATTLVPSIPFKETKHIAFASRPMQAMIPEYWAKESLATLQRNILIQKYLNKAATNIAKKVDRVILEKVKKCTGVPSYS